MADISQNNVTQVLDAIGAGDPHSASRLLPLVYDELRKLAARRLTNERAGQTLDATGLVHEAYLRLIGSAGGGRWNSRGHFFAAAAEAMRRILVENARRKTRLKHGGHWRRVDLAEANLPVRKTPDEILAIDEALSRFAEVEPQAAEIVKLRYFAGMSVEQAAEALGMSRATANRHWAYAKSWLRCEIDRESAG